MGTSISCKNAFAALKEDGKRYFCGQKLIAEAAFSRSSGRQTRPCGLLMKRPAAPSCFPKYFVDSLNGHAGKPGMAIGKMLFYPTTDTVSPGLIFRGMVCPSNTTARNWPDAAAPAVTVRAFTLPSCRS